MRVFWGACRNANPNNAYANLHKGCLSQWQVCSFEVGGVIYSSAEQYMMAEKARTFGDDETLEKILSAKSPRKIKALGREVKGFDGKPLSADIWFPCTEAVAQNVNNPTYNDNRIFRLGMYYPVHGMSVTRHCPKCGRLNLYMGDTWNENSKTLFPNGIIEPFNWGQVPRTEQEKDAHKRGEYDALECYFCGELTHSYDNFMFMQTQLKRMPPSFIKEATDEALASISHAKHIVLLGYSMPLDDAIWGSLLTMMSRRNNDERLYCSVVATHDPDGPKGWIYGDDLDAYLKSKSDVVKDKEKVRAINNAIIVFGKENVRAYEQGIPTIFGHGTVEEARKLLYPYDQPGWKVPEFTANGVIRN